MQPLKEIFAGADIWIFLLAFTLDTRGEWAQINLSTRMDKVRHREASTPVVIGVDDSVGGALQNAIGEVLKHIPSIDDDLSVEGMNRSPRTVSLKKLKTTLGRFAEEGNEVDIFVCRCTHRAGLGILWNGWVMNDPEDGVAIACHVGKE